MQGIFSSSFAPFSVLPSCAAVPRRGRRGAGNSAGNSAPATDAGLRIVTENFPPFNYAGPDGKPGEGTDVVNGILARLNQTAAIEVMPWAEDYRLALAGPRVVLYSTAGPMTARISIRWVGPIGTIEYTLYARNGSGLQVGSLEAAKKAGSIGVVKDDVRYQFLQENNFGNITTCASDAECLQDLVAGKTDLWLGASGNAAYVARGEGIDPTAFTAVYPIRAVPLYIAFSNDTPDSVVAGWQDALDAMKRDGTFDAIEEKYGMTPAAGTEDRPRQGHRPACTSISWLPKRTGS